MTVCMFVKNSFEYDARVTKEAKSLIAAGHDVTVVAIHVPGATAERETTSDGIDVVRVSRMSFGMRIAQRINARYCMVPLPRARSVGDERTTHQMDAATARRKAGRVEMCSPFRGGKARGAPYRMTAVRICLYPPKRV